MNKKLLFVLGGGIGNIILATPAIRLAVDEGHVVDIFPECNSSQDLYEILRINGVREVTNNPKDSYDFQLNGPFTSVSKHVAKSFIRPRIRYDQHRPETHVYLDLIRQIGIYGKPGCVEINVPQKQVPDFVDHVAIYPGSKPNWAMKRWDKFDDLCQHLDKVVLVGTEADINSHGDPTWINKNWNWKEDTKHFHGTLAETAAVLKQCKAFIGNDGGVAHIAAATGILTFVIFGPSSDVKNKPWSKNAFVISKDEKCRPCQFSKGKDGKEIFGANKSTCPFDMACMRNLTVKDVLDQIRQIGRLEI